MDVKNSFFDVFLLARAANPVKHICVFYHFLRGVARRVHVKSFP